MVRLGMYPNDLRKISLFLMTYSNLAYKLLVDANSTLVSIINGYLRKSMQENNFGIT